MKIQQVKIDPWNRIMILCSHCNKTHPEIETYAIMEHKFKYICHGCVDNLPKPTKSD